MSKYPVIERWNRNLLDLKDTRNRFRQSEWNYFLVDQESGVLGGYWLAKEGYEDLGSDDFDEVLHVIEGKLYVSCAGEEFVALPGDTVVVRRGRAMRITVHEITRVCFFCYGIDDPAAYEKNIRQAMDKREKKGNDQ